MGIFIDLMNKFNKRGFTLIELLAVIAILLVLVSLLLPIIGQLRGLGMIVRCKAVVRNFGTTALLFAGDNDGYLPAMSTAGGYFGPAPFDRGWLGSEVGIANPGLLVGDADFQRPGVLQDYMHAPMGPGQSYYRCPLLPVAPLGTAKKESTVYGSNGGFDYTMFSYANAARLSQMPRTAYVTMPNAEGNPTTITNLVAAPIFTEEDPRYGNNNDYIDPDHTSVNRDGVWHYRGTCMYFTTAGSVEQVAFNTPIGPEAQAWRALNPRGVLVNLGHMGGFRVWK
jgi:prepilin-type N-terminal cleavage/methylation domain-containing protein